MLEFRGSKYIYVSTCNPNREHIYIDVYPWSRGSSAVNALPSRADRGGAARAEVDFWQWANGSTKGWKGGVARDRVGFWRWMGKAEAVANGYMKG